MKNALKMIILLFTVINAKAQTQTKDIKSPDVLADARINFNKNLIRKGLCDLKQLPCPEFLFTQADECEVNIEGLIFTIKHGLIVEIKGVNLAEQSLIQVNERLGLLDKLQQAYSEASNQEYCSNRKNIHAIVANDRKFFAVLKALKATARGIKKICRSNLSAIEQSDALAKMRFANIDWQFYSQIMKVENEKIIFGKLNEGDSKNGR